MSKRFTIVTEEFILYFSGTAYKISNGECTFRLWHNKEESQKVCDKLNELHKENEILKEENKRYKYILQDLGLLMSDEEVRDIRMEIADKIINPLCKENGFDVDVDCNNGFTIIPKR